MKVLESEKENFWIHLCAEELEFAKAIQQEFTSNVQKHISELVSFTAEYNSNNVRSISINKKYASIVHKLLGSVSLMGFVSAGQALSMIEDKLNANDLIIDNDLLEQIIELTEMVISAITITINDSNN